MSSLGYEYHIAIVLILILNEYSRNHEVPCREVAMTNLGIPKADRLDANTTAKTAARLLCILATD